MSFSIYLAGISLSMKALPSLHPTFGSSIHHLLIFLVFTRPISHTHGSEGWQPYTSLCEISRNRRGPRGHDVYSQSPGAHWLSDSRGCRVL